MAASADEVIAELQDMVECPVCLEPFEEPRMLPCQHSFCTKCLQGLLGTGRKIRCPCCNKEAPVPSGVRQLTVDFRANTQLEMLSKYEKAKAARKMEAEAAAVEAVISQDAFEILSPDEHCPVCEEIPTVSKNLSCGHCLCENCVQFLLPVGGDTLHCPTCSRQTTIVTTSSTGLHIPSLWGLSGSSQPKQQNPHAPSNTPRRSFLPRQPRRPPPPPPQTPPQTPALHQHSPRLSHMPDRGPSHPPPSSRSPVFLPFTHETQTSAASSPLWLSGQPQMGAGAVNSAEESRLTFHPQCGKNVVIDANRGTAHRKDPMHCMADAAVRTSRHLKPNELFEVWLDKKVDKWGCSMKIGVATYCPTGSDLPTDMNKLGSGPWWMSGCKVHNMSTTIKQYEQDLYKLKVGDRVGVQRRVNSDLHYYINGVDLGVAASDVPAAVYGVINVCGNAEQVTINDTPVDLSPALSWEIIPTPAWRQAALPTPTSQDALSLNPDLTSVSVTPQRKEDRLSLINRIKKMLTLKKTPKQ